MTSNDYPRQARFADLHIEELSWLRNNDRDVKGLIFQYDDKTDEPRVQATPTALVGLALSGGGIRSATFGLGILQALNELKVLPFVDYLATVSGGGYIGGWWSAWKARPECRRDFPVPKSNEVEAPAVRHLREFSRFLIPRIALGDLQLWLGVISVLGGIMFSLLAANALLILGISVWLIAARGLWLRLEWLSMGALTLLVLFGFECESWRRRLARLSASRSTAPLALKDGKISRWWQRFLDPRRSPLLGFDVEKREVIDLLWAGGLCLGVATLDGLMWAIIRRDAFALPRRLVPTSQPASWLEAAPGTVPSWRWLTPMLVWLGSAVVLLGFRFLTSRFAAERNMGRLKRYSRPPLRLRAVRSLCDRTIARLIVLSYVWLIAVAVWALGCFCTAIINGRLAWTAPSTIIAALTSGSGFIILRKWIVQLPSQVHSTQLSAKLRLLIVRWLAYATVFCGGAALASAEIVLLVEVSRWLGSTVEQYNPIFIFLLALGTIGLIALCFDPEEMGLHPFYRGRISRAYLGASNVQAHIRGVRPHPEDDIRLTSLSTRPIHLICCTANGPFDDALATLDRGCRSAVASQVGLALGDACLLWTDRDQQDVPLLGSFLTASAAALNPMMGCISKRLGLAVTFLMAALNVRLGLWIHHPWVVSSEEPFPGLLYLRELFGLASCRTAETHQTPQRFGHFVHLSDGGHFENLGLYELVRRHCRYIIVSDCGADPDVAFDDFGNALRRIREDFGVEIEIDLTPLKPDETGYAWQHMVVGTIRFSDKGDEGILLYVKPGLTGDEPYDISQYRVRNRRFPHESTGDQFYDEAQWEAYRRLGEHVARSSFQFLEASSERPTPQRIFSGARWEWYPSPPRLQESFLMFTERYSRLEGELREAGPLRLTREIFPEVGGASSSATEADHHDHDETMLHFLLQMTQLMEDVWLGCHLETHANHPLNLGWANLFLRWTNAATFQRWWPILKPLYGSGLREWVERLVPSLSAAGRAVHYDLTTYDLSEKAPLKKQWMFGDRANGREVVHGWAYVCGLRSALGMRTDVGVLWWDVDSREATWNSEDFVVMPGLWGTGIGTEFMKKVIDDLKDNHAINACRVRLKSPITHDANSRCARTDMLDFYMSLGFLAYSGDFLELRVARP